MWRWNLRLVAGLAAGRLRGAGDIIPRGKPAFNHLIHRPCGIGPQTTKAELFMVKQKGERDKGSEAESKASRERQRPEGERRGVSPPWRSRERQRPEGGRGASGAITRTGAAAALLSTTVRPESCVTISTNTASGPGMTWGASSSGGNEKRRMPWSL